MRFMVYDYLHEGIVHISNWSPKDYFPIIMNETHCEKRVATVST